MVPDTQFEKSTSMYINMVSLIFVGVPKVFTIQLASDGVNVAVKLEPKKDVPKMVIFKALEPPTKMYEVDVSVMVIKSIFPTIFVVDTATLL